MGRGRRLAAGASLLASAGGFAWLALQQAPHWIEWRGMAFSAGLAAASYGLTRKNVVAQVLSRGYAWIVFAPCALVMLVELAKGRLMEPAMTGLGIASGLALLLARPMLHGEEARAAFAPSKFRTTFLAACTAAVTIGLVTGMVAWELLWSGALAGGIALGALGASIIASGLGVLRMRGWGIALATLNALLSLVAGAVVGRSDGVALAGTALPGLLFLLPIVLANLGLGESSAPAPAIAASRVRVADDAARVRIEASDSDLALDDEATNDVEAADPERRVARVA